MRYGHSLQEAQAKFNSISPILIDSHYVSKHCAGEDMVVSTVVRFL